ncbi:MAG: hypothetical protein QXU12_03265 [Nitrososphaerota archaeon]
MGLPAEIRRSIVYRSERGKTIRLCMTIRGNEITHVTFTGDFFGEPAEELSKLGEILIGLNAGDVNELFRRIDEFFNERIEWIAGASPNDFKQALVKLLESFSDND